MSSPQVDQLSFKPALTVIAAMVVVIGLAIVAALFFNNQRKSSVISEYDTETTQLIASKPDVTKKLFTETFDQCQQLLLQYQASESGMNKSHDITCEPGKEALAELGVTTLKNSSSVAYVRYNDGLYNLLEASGKYNSSRTIIDGYPYSHFDYDPKLRESLQSYFISGANIDRWQDFITYIEGKEVIVPVVIEDQKIGYIFRGVIER